MQYIKLTVIAALAVLIGACSTNSKPYKDTSLPFEERVDDLVSRMSLQEKVDMLRYDSPGVPRLDIPAHNFWNECLHGVARAGRATVFPQAIGMAAMWDTDQMGRIADAISDEARAKHHRYASQGKFGIYQGLTFWTPNINIFRDPRWGRGMETYGEDPYLTGELAIRFIKGLQGDDPKYLKLVATAKHFAVHSGPEATRHSFDVWPSDYDLKETYFPHFKRTVQEAGVYSVMCAYQRFRGMPCCGNKFLESVLREEWGFPGYIVSDCWAVRDFYEEDHHEVAATPEEAAAMAVLAGTDLNCGDTYPHLTEAVRQGLITEEQLDVSVKRVLLAMMKLGMFDNPKNVKYTSIPYDVVESDEHIALAREAARKSMVLLKNENNTLPFSKDIRRVAVIGPNADDLEVLYANYNGYATSPVTILSGIRNKLPDAEVVFAQGCTVADNFPYFETIPTDYLYTDTTLTKNGLKAEYFKNTTLEGAPSHTAIDPNIDFVWGTTPPYDDMKYDKFSVRWTGVFVPPADGRYAIGQQGFYATRIFFDDELLVDFESVHHPVPSYEYLNLEGGRAYDIKVEFRQDNTEYPVMRLLWDYPKADLRKEALELAASADAVILCMGLTPLLEGEQLEVKVEGFDSGDRLDIRLPRVQTELMKELRKLNKPTVVVLTSGSALSFNWEAENMPAIIQAWYPGQEGGNAVADVIFGDYNPAGRLPLTYYKDINQIPNFDNYSMAGKTYRYFRDTPLYEFGYGLSYTTFEYEMKNAPETIVAGEPVTVSVDVTNTGQMDGEEVVQLYVSLPDTRLKTAVRSLQGFDRIHLKAGETKTVEFTLEPYQFAARDNDNIAQVTAGTLRISVGGKQPDPKAVGARNVVEKNIKITGTPHYIDD